MFPGLQRALATRRAMALVIVVIMALAATSIAIGFLTDDHSFRAAVRSTNVRAPAAYDLFRFATDSETNQLRVRVGHLPWWSAPDLKIHFLRPLTGLLFAADVKVFGESPLGYHLHSLAWYLALLVAAAVMFRRVLPPVAATIALAAFGLAASHVEAYAWIAARHVVTAAVFAAAALAVRGGRGRAREALAFVLLVLALASSEAGLAAVPLWLAGVLAAEDRPWRARLVACVPAVVLAIAYLVVYSAIGCGTRASGGYHDPAADPLGFIGLAARRVPILLGDAALGIPAELAHVVDEAHLAVLGVLAVGVVGLAIWLTRAGDGPRLRTLGWWIAGGVLATIPGAAGYPAGRVLVIPDLAFAAVLGLVIYRGLFAGDVGVPSGLRAGAGGEPGRALAGTVGVPGGVHAGDVSEPGSVRAREVGKPGGVPAGEVGEPGGAPAGEVGEPGRVLAGASSEPGGALAVGASGGVPAGEVGAPGGMPAGEVGVPGGMPAGVVGVPGGVFVANVGVPGRVLAGVIAIVHLVVAPIATWRAIDKLARRGEATEAIAREAIALAPPSGRVFVIGASDPLVFLYPRGIATDLAPGAIRCWSVLSAARSAQRVTRSDAHTLTIEALDRPLLAGSFDQLFRAPERPFVVGAEVEQCGATYRVAEVRDGKPTRIEVHLRRSFDDPEIAVLAWRSEALARFALPKVGDTVELPWRAGPSGAL